jgi:hypothetical protein
MAEQNDHSMCQCFHYRWLHDGPKGKCQASVGVTHTPCKCKEFQRA